MATPIILTTLAVFAVTYILTKLVQLLLHIRDLGRWFKDVPGPSDRHWFHGHLHLFPKRPSKRIAYLLELGSKFRRYFCLWIGPARVTIVVNHPSTVKAVMKTSEPKPQGFSGMYRFGLPWLGKGLLITSNVSFCHNTAKRKHGALEPKPQGFSGMYRFGLPWLGEGLLIAGGERWARSRRLLTPAFHFDILKPYVRVYNEAAERLIGNLDSHCESGRSFEVFSHVSKCTLDIILRCAFSYETDCQKPGVVHPYLKAVNELSNIWWLREKRPIQYFDFIFYLTQNGRQFRKYCKYVHQVAENVIHKRKASLEASSVIGQRKYLDFLDILLTARDEQGNGLTLLEIRNEVDTFLFEGHDTTASAISWTLYALANNPECQRKAQTEVDNILEGREDENIEWGDLNKMEYLTQCLKETLRHHSPVPFIQREITHDFQVEGRTFPRGTPVTVHIYGLHHNADVWDEPDSYIPERFSKENVAKMDSYQFVPFSAGPRNCIGQNFAMNEEKVVVARLLRRFDFTLDPNHVVQKKIAAIMKTENGVLMYVSRRNLRT